MIQKKLSDSIRRNKQNRKANLAAKMPPRLTDTFFNGRNNAPKMHNESSRGHPRTQDSKVENGSTGQQINGNVG